MEAGLYVTFFTEGESFESELPPVGPLEHLVMRDRTLVADRGDVHHVDHFGGGSRWIEAELELQRAIGNESGGARRPALRIGAPQGVYLRFAQFESADGDGPVPELGPYAMVVVTNERVEADGDVLATRSGTKHPWELTSVGGPALAGIIRPDIGFRTRSTDYHPRIHPARPRVRSDPSRMRLPAKPEPKNEPVIEQDVSESRATDDTPPPVAAPTARARSTSHYSARDSAIVESATLDDRPPTPEPPSLRSRLGGDFTTRQSSATARREETDRPAVNRRVAFFVVGALMIGLVAFGALRTSPSSDSGSVVGIGKPVRGPHWDYTVATVSRASQVSSAVARGVYLIVWVTATNRDAPIASLSPRDFAIVDGSGAQYAPVTASDLVYRSDSNPGSPLTWMTSYAVGQPVSTPVIFDVNPTLRGVQLTILEVPTVRVQLD